MPIIDFAKAVRRRAAQLVNGAPKLTPEEASMLSRLKGVRDAALAAPTPDASHWSCPRCGTRNPFDTARCADGDYELRKPAVLR